MNFKKIFAGLLVTMLALPAVTAFAADTGDTTIVSDVKQINEQSHFNSFTGTVKKVTEREGVAGSKLVLVENEKGIEANIIVSDDTYILNDVEIAVGSEITGYYDSNAPMIMIYPVQYSAEVVAIDSKDQNIKVDIFDKNLVSADHTLKLNISNDTEVISADGKSFAGRLASKKLVVIYDVATKSIPAQTTPTKVVVLDGEQAIAPLYDVSTMEMVVNNEKIEAPAAYTNEQGTVMVPLRAIADALALDVQWDDQLKSIILDKGISLKVGEDNYLYMGNTPIQLGTAPALVEGTTYVPLSFFRDVLQMNNAYVFEAQIVIDNGEKMQ
ncbi:copper amine oxidase N-terminal domain-containing protein [Peptococcaceae bacterium 1198_IL3148]